MSPTTKGSPAAIPKQSRLNPTGYTMMAGVPDPEMAEYVAAAVHRDQLRRASPAPEPTPEAVALARRVQRARAGARRVAPRLVLRRVRSSRAPRRARARRTATSPPSADAEGPPPGSRASVRSGT